MAYCRLKHRKNSSGEKVFYVDYKFQGKRTKFTIGLVEQRAAKKIADRILAQLLEGINPHEANNQKEVVRLSELATKYIEHCRISQSKNTIEIKVNAVRLLQEFLGDVPITSITPEKIEQWLLWLSKERSATTVSINFRSIRALMNWAGKREILTKIPTANGIVTDVKQREPDPGGYFTLDEIQLIKKEIKGEKLFQIVFLALETGGRINELINLRWDDIDFKQKRVLFRGSETKTGKRRFVPIRSSAIEELKKWDRKSGSIFYWKTSTYPSKMFTKLLVANNLSETSQSKRTFHNLRHTYASFLIMASKDIFTVSRLLGHSSVKVTEKYYGHLIPSKAEQTVELIPY